MRLETSHCFLLTQSSEVDAVHYREQVWRRQLWQEQSLFYSGKSRKSKRHIASCIHLINCSLFTGETFGVTTWSWSKIAPMSSPEKKCCQLFKTIDWRFNNLSHPSLNKSHHYSRHQGCSYQDDQASRSTPLTVPVSDHKWRLRTDSSFTVTFCFLHFQCC